MVNANNVRATTQNMVSHATCTMGDGFSVNYTENQTVEYPTQIEFCSIEYITAASHDTENLPATSQNVVSHETCTMGDGFSAGKTENHTAGYPSQIEFFSIECSSGTNHETADLPATSNTVVSHATCTMGDGFSANCTENHAARYPKEIDSKCTNSKVSSNESKCTSNKVSQNILFSKDKSKNFKRQYCANNFSEATKNKKNNKRQIATKTNKKK